jgi:ABC-type multidrug transport system fused ATPase/permease subunit
LPGFQADFAGVSQHIRLGPDCADALADGKLGAVMSTRAAAPAMPKSVYAYIWRVSGRQQVILCLLTGVVVALSAAPLELQRRITDDAFGAKDIRLLALYCALYLALIIVQGVVKYILNVSRGRTVEVVSRKLRLRRRAMAARPRR